MSHFGTIGNVAFPGNDTLGRMPTNRRANLRYETAKKILRILAGCTHSNDISLTEWRFLARHQVECPLSFGYVGNGM